LLDDEDELTGAPRAAEIVIFDLEDLSSSESDTGEGCSDGEGDNNVHW